MFAPDAVNDTLSPLQIAAEDAETETAGFAFTVIVIFVVSAQFVPSVPINVYVVVADGVTLKEAPEKLPGCQLYDVAPDAESVVDAPEQVVVEVAEALTVIGEPSVTVAVVVVEQLLPSVMVQVYVPTPRLVAVALLPPLGAQLYV